MSYALPAPQQCELSHVTCLRRGLTVHNIEKTNRTLEAGVKILWFHQQYLSCVAVKAVFILSVLNGFNVPLEKHQLSLELENIL